MRYTLRVRGTGSARLLLLTAGLLAAYAAPAGAALLRDLPVAAVQPDGTKLELLASGDEFYNWLHDRSGYTVVVDPGTGGHVYAALKDDHLVPTHLVPGRDDPADAGLTAGLLDGWNVRKALIDGRRAVMGGVGLHAPRTGALNNLVVFIRFADEAEFTGTVAAYNTLFNATAAGSTSMRAYFTEASYNQLTISSSYYPVPTGSTVVSFKDSHNRGYFRPWSSSNAIGYTTQQQRIDREQILIKNAVDAIASQVPASLDIDADNDGYVDAITFNVYGSPDGWNDLLWPHAWALYTRTAYINGVQVYSFNLQLNDALNSGVLCHEMFHVLGAPDLYHYSQDGRTPVGPWDLMEWTGNVPQHMGAFMKWKYGGWLAAPTVISAAGSYTLNPVTSSTGSFLRFAAPGSSSEYFVVEYRRRIGTFEGGLPSSGMLVYRVNTTAGDGNADGPPDELYLFRPGGTPGQDGTVNNASLSSGAGRTSFTPTSDPYPFLSNGTAVAISLTAIGSAGATISFTFGGGPCVPDCAGKPGCADDGCGGVCQPCLLCPDTQACEDLYQGHLGCLDGSSIPADNPTGCHAGSGCSGNFSCWMTGSSTSVCIENCGTCPTGQVCTQITEGGYLGCLLNGSLPPDNETGCADDGLCSGNFSCFCTDQNCSGSICVGNCSAPHGGPDGDADGDADVDPECECAPGSVCCGSDCRFLDLGTNCGSAATACSGQDTCDGAGHCLPNNFPAETPCGDTTSECVRPDWCDGAGNCLDRGYAPSGTPCGDPGDTVCDNPDTCSGTGACLKNREPSTTLCRGAEEGSCDQPEYCNEALGICPPDVAWPALHVCRRAAGECDLPELCTGLSKECPDDRLKDQGAICRISRGGCDPAEICDGADPDCPDDAIEPEGAVCRAAVGLCDKAELCDGQGDLCPLDQVWEQGHECRPSAGLCDPVEVCGGVLKSCPDDVVSPRGFVCRQAVDPTCDLAETCPGGDPQCPDDQVRQRNTLCRSQQGVCDVAERCDGSSGYCPADGVRDRNFLCRTASEPCDVVEYCDGVEKICPFDAVKPETSPCRTAQGVCDRTEFCDGSQKSCPDDGFLTDETPCRPASDLCDRTEYCPGNGKECPADAVRDPGESCRQPAGTCDIGEVCDGILKGCPADRFVVRDTPCRLAAGPCDEQEECSGDGPACPEDRFVQQGTACRDARGVCDAEERCTGQGVDCPHDLALTPLDPCRDAAGGCDETEFCDGVGDDCPVDLFKPLHFVCRDKVGFCDLAEECDGTTPACPDDLVVPAGITCRRSAGECDPAERCDGTSGLCPDDALHGGSVGCRASTGACDPAEACDGAHPVCPDDLLAGGESICRPATGECDLSEVCGAAGPACPGDLLIEDWTACLNEQQQPGACFDGTCEVLPPDDVCERADTIEVGTVYQLSMNGRHAYLPVDAACIDPPVAGPDAFFLIDLEAAVQYRLTAAPVRADVRFGAVVYDACRSAQGSCRWAAVSPVDGQPVVIGSIEPETAARYVIQIVAGRDAPSNDDYTLLVERVVLVDGDAPSDGDSDLDGESDQTDQTDQSDSDLPDGDLVDGDEPIDGDTAIDGDEPIDGDTAIDGDEPIDGDTIDGDTAIDGDTPPDGDTEVDGDAPSDGDAEADDDQYSFVAEGCADCSASGGGGTLTALLLLLFGLVRWRRTAC